MTGTTYGYTARAATSRLSRAVGVFLAAAVIASIVAGIEVLPGLGRPRAAHAAEEVGRLCHNSRASGSFTTTTERAKFDLYVPNGVRVTVAGSVDVVGPNSSLGTYQTRFFVEPIGDGNFGTALRQPRYDQAFAWSWTNTGSSRVIPVIARQDWDAHIAWRFTLTLSNGGGEAPCAPVSADVTLGHSCAAKAVSKPTSRWPTPSTRPPATSTSPSKTSPSPVAGPVWR